jgi:hypothetical protein
MTDKLKTEAIESAYHKLTDVERSEIDELCDGIALRIKGNSSRGSLTPMSKSMTLELIGKIGMELAKNDEDQT